MGKNVQPFVIDTNILLDCFIFADPDYQILTKQIVTRKIDWIATQAMHDEFLRTLDYPAILRWQEKCRRSELNKHNNPLMQYARLVDDAPSEHLYRCKDNDDQKFIDLALAHHAVLLSKDKAVLALTKKLHHTGVFVRQLF